MDKLDQLDDRELRALRRALGDMAALSSLPAMWVNADEERIATNLADALVQVLDLDGVRVSFRTEQGESREVSRFPQGQPVDLVHLLQTSPNLVGCANNSTDHKLTTTIRSD
ncbi:MULTISPECIES: hypothetical protein [unclassified Mesorhizobium]|uniref:hypothetical protein n=1 Tax=unclassified Mesorhizobium TaxID=325217 RepID=UPI00112E5C19|nr:MULTISPECIES: hypothetical protein [unclassified Mesorhizobium]MBZ9982589.1 hypothetical protein [Mesorhizobium sp. BR-1-1-8]TPL26877.1 hypothetical protein FJ947_29450 [Mesorhizobium sp. B2-4-8]TPL59040.1 hypothetical protein FJ949_27790 [Mesorhizobium sp. B2-4-1]